MAAPRPSSALLSALPSVMPPHLADGVDVPDGTILQTRLSNDEVEAIGLHGAEVSMVSGPSCSFKLHIGGQPDIAMAFREVGDSRVVISHRDGKDLRTAGFVDGELDLQRKLGMNDKERTKKRTLDATKQKKASSMLMMPAESDEPKAKRSRAVQRRATPVVVKRPRVRSSPAPLKSNGNSNTGASPLNGLTSNPVQPVVPHSSRRTSVLPTSTPSPHVSPPGMTSMAARAAAVLGNGHRPPRSSPPSAPGIPASARVSAAPSPAASRGPSPARLTSAPTSPRTSVRPSLPSAPPSVPTKDVVRHVVHLLALQDMSPADVKNRLANVPVGGDDVIRKVLQMVATAPTKKYQYKLKPARWAEVTKEYELYSAPEREFIARELSNRSAGGAANGSGSSQGSVVSPSTGDGSPSAAIAAGARKPAAAAGSRSLNGSGVNRTKAPPVDADLDKFVSRVLSGKARSFKTISSSADDAQYRKDFNTLWTNYVKLFEAVNDVQRSLATARGQRNTATFRDLAAVDGDASKLMRGIEERFDKYRDALGKIHGEIKQLKSRIEEYRTGR